MEQNIKTILKERARKLAEPLKDDSLQINHVEVLEFLLATENYGIESSFVREVYPLKDFTVLSTAPAFVFGIINVRGEILSIIDIRKFFDLPVVDLSDLNRVIIVHNQEMNFGILAERVVGLRTIDKVDILPPLPTLQGIRREYLKGITKEQLVILDGFKLLSDKNIIVGEQN
ncbi:MAG: chemotaxis protein CheW [Bdellovibrionia bacterium]